MSIFCIFVRIICMFDAMNTSFPLGFTTLLSRLAQSVDIDTAALLLELQDDPVLSIRYNPLKATAPMAANLPKGEPVAWCGCGRYLSQRPSFTFDPLFHAGAYYVQEASSMFLAHVVRTLFTDPIVALDLCAAPGGKATLLCNYLPNGSLLVANEAIHSRVPSLMENMVKWGFPNHIVTNNDPSIFGRFGGQFDLIVADVPCSGEGMFRKDMGAISHWSPDTIEICRQRQRRIVADAWDGLRTGGYLIYSTCTFNTQENEDNAAWIASELGAEFVEIAVPSEWNITGNLTAASFPVYRFLPHRTRGEGFFLAVLRKTSDAPAMRMPRVHRPSLKRDALLRVLLTDPDDYLMFELGDNLIAATAAQYDRIVTLCDRLRTLTAGIMLGTYKGNDFQPASGLAMSIALSPNAFPRYELSYEQAIAYLRGETFRPDGDPVKGTALVTYKGMPLGFIRHLGNRVNNHHPKAWRIRTTPSAQK
jgi:16S rRNA C967 or C1407 C5-methylase (RsmB/RsmF family)/NOL1/NOP2/fmu family ribosome biogenesis protein